MKKINIIFYVLFLSVLTQNVLANKEKLVQANDLYMKAQYEQAAAVYEEVIQTDGIAPELFYNLGNAYYKSGEIAKSILNYERALRMSPLYEDAKVNLEMANLKVIDNVEMTESFFLKRWNETLMKMLTSNQWLYLSALFFLLSLIALFIFIFGTTRSFRQSSFYSGIVVFILSVIMFLYAGSRKTQLVGQQEAIIMSGVVIVKSSPDKSGTDIFQLHEGTKVKIISTVGKWDEIKLGNGNVGWVEHKHVEAI
jgi:tetratricopeptide (TPR) repeat protein